MTERHEEIKERARVFFKYAMKAVQDAEEEFDRVELSITGKSKDGGRIVAGFDVQFLRDMAELCEWDGKVISDEERDARKLLDPILAKGRAPLGGGE